MNATSQMPCGCHQGAWWGVTPPPMCDFHRNQFTTCAPPPNVGTSTTVTWPPKAPPLSDADVERIAQRVVELLKATP